MKMRPRGAWENLPAVIHWATSSALLLCGILLQGRGATAAGTALRVQASSSWHGSDGDWSTFDVSVGSTSQSVQLTVSTTESGLRAYIASDGDDEDSSKILALGHGFNPGSSQTWKDTRISDNDSYPYIDSTQSGLDSVLLSADRPSAVVGIELINSTSQFFAGLGSIGLLNSSGTSGNATYESLIRQLAQNVGDQGIPSLAYGYTAGASYAGKAGVPASLVFGGYDARRVTEEPNLSFALGSSAYYPGGVPEVAVIGLKVTGIGENSTSWNVSHSSEVTLLDASSTFSAVIDPAVAYMWFPTSVCDQLAEIFNLTWHEGLEAYLFANETEFNKFKDDRTLSFTLMFERSDLAGPTRQSTSLTVSAAAFALKMKVPVLMSKNESTARSYREIPYFAFKRRDISEVRPPVIGRAFMQEVYLFTDYDRGLFSLSQAVFPDNPETDFSVINVVSPAPKSTSRISTGTIAGISVGGTFGLVLLVCVWFWLRRRRITKALAVSVGNNQSRSSRWPMTDPPKYERPGYILGVANTQNINSLKPPELVNDSLWMPATTSVSAPRYVSPSITLTPSSCISGVGLGGNQVAELPDDDNTINSKPKIVEAPSPLPPVLPETELSGTTDCSGSHDKRDSQETATSEHDSTSSNLTSASDSSGIAPTLEAYKRRAVDTLMTEFKSLLSHGPHIGVSIRAGGGDSSSSSTQVERVVSSSSKSSGESVAGNKHGRDESNTQNTTKKAKVADGRKFACPFYRRNPKKHLRHRACAGPGWNEVRRVKEHLYRIHALPIFCHRCGTVMPTDADLRAHQRQPQGCEVRLVDLPEGFDKIQEMELRKKKHGESEENRWFAMYRILFPDEDGDLIPSPYYQDGNISDAERQRLDELKQYERFQRREMLRVVRRLLQDAVEGMAGPLEDQLRTQFVNIVQQAQSEVFKAYRADDTKSKPGSSGKGKGLPAPALHVAAQAVMDPMAVSNNLWQTQFSDLGPQTGAYRQGHEPPSSSDLISNHVIPNPHLNPTHLSDDPGLTTGYYYGSELLSQAALQSVFEMGSAPLANFGHAFFPPPAHGPTHDRSSTHSNPNVTTTDSSSGGGFLPGDSQAAELSAAAGSSDYPQIATDDTGHQVGPVSEEEWATIFGGL
ncbi:aspartic peptidase domain-containing protein [Apodospora peruviana]|uniref:Aspartic peptidase domain-containing protein n=1 Tax=Apodospora peruviana TaxID=516989 RepID=A0AAE0I3C5_9PEZI|nr:aspartic peptidase domain-containing protein [Apodospora peruviana]